MKLPAVTMATAFASGMALGFWSVIAKYEAAPCFLRAATIAAALLIIVAIMGTRKSRLGFRGLSLAAWLLLPGRASSCLIAC